ncbi:MAG: cytochrome c biogenesis protein CcdA [Spirochaetales bacterium]|nr:cytochrome c biogenesis protein CcdA [Spirochaetales bacterium]
MGTGIDLNFGIAFIAGVLSFLSPCILPLIPAYLSLMGGTSIQGLKESGSRRWGAFLNTVFFVIGFSIVFIVLGILFSTTFTLLSGVTRIVNIVAGSIVVVLGFNFIFDFWKMLNFEKRFQMERRPTSMPASLLFGMAFGAGWSPCIGPILSSILFLAGSTGSLLRAVVLLSVYSLGLGLPFLLAGLFLPFALRQLDRIKKHLRTIKIISGVFLIFIGGLIILGRLQQLNIVLFQFAARIETWGSEYPVLARNVFGAVFFALAVLILVFYVRKTIREKNISVTGAEVQSVSRRDKTAAGWFKPVRLFFLLVFLSAGFLSVTGVLDFSSLLSSWFTFQGI